MRKLGIVILSCAILLLFSCASTLKAEDTESTEPYTDADRKTVRIFLSVREEVEKTEELLSSLLEADGNCSEVIESIEWLPRHRTAEKTLMEFIREEDLPRGAEIKAFTSISGSYSSLDGVGSVDIKCTYQYQIPSSPALCDGEYYITGRIIRTDTALTASDMETSLAFFGSLECTFSDGLYSSASVGGKTVNVSLLNETARP